MISVLNYSAGMDSTGLLLHLLTSGDKVFCVSFDYGQRHKVELERGTTQMKYLRSNGFDVERKIVNIPFLGEISNSSLTGNGEIPTGFYEQDNMKSTVVENRNAIFASITYAYALALSKKYDSDCRIAQGLHSGDHAIYPDCTGAFRDALDNAFKIGNYGSERISYYTPFMEGNKTTILEESIDNCGELNLDFNTIFRNTNTSYNPDPITGESSGESGADVERVLAFHELGLIDPVTYKGGFQKAKDFALNAQKEFNQGK